MKWKTEEYSELKQGPWYVDDSILKCKRDRAEVILQHLNNQKPEIQFTKEEEVDNKITVLNLELDVDGKKI